MVDNLRREEQRVAANSEAVRAFHLLRKPEVANL